MSSRKRRGGEATTMSDFMKELSATYGSPTSTKKALFMEDIDNDDEDNKENIYDED